MLSEQIPQRKAQQTKIIPKRKQIVLTTTPIKVIPKQKQTVLTINQTKVLQLQTEAIILEVRTILLEEAETQEEEEEV